MTDSPDPLPEDPDVAEASALAMAILETLVKRGYAPETALAGLTIAWARMIETMEFTRERFREICEGLENVLYGDE